MPSGTVRLLASAVLSVAACRPAAEAQREAPRQGASGVTKGADAEPIALAKPAGPIAPTTEHAFSVLDMLAMQRLSAPAVSPSGERVAFVVRTTDLTANKGRTDIWSVALSGGDPQQLTTHPDSDTGPVWASDGASIYFLSTRSGRSQAWSIPAQGGAPTQVTDLPLDVGNLVVSPSGNHIVVSAEVFPDCGTLECTKERTEAVEADQRTGTLFDRMFVRHWDAWKDGRRSHLLAIPVGGGTPVDLTKELDADVPSKPFGGTEEIAVAPDGTQVVFTARDAAGAGAEPWSTNFDLFVVPIDGSAPPRRITDNRAWDTHPVFSPDGKTLAYTAMERPGFEADRFRVVLRPWPDGEPRVLTQAWDRSVRDMVWSSTGDTLYVIAQDLGQRPVFAVDAASGAARKLVGDGTFSSPGVAGTKLVFLRSDLRNPAELWTAALDGEGVAPLTHFNDSLTQLARMGDPEQFEFKGARGETVYGWLVKPVDFKEGQKYPVAFLIHGGPQGSFGNNFHYRWNPQAYAGEGYVAVMIDFHGSTGYGQAFTDAITGDWGGKPLQDLQKGLAHVVANYGFVDGDRVCALGASYGGYMINWIAGRWPDRFKCLVNHDGVFDMRSMYYATEELWFPEWEHGGAYYASPRTHEKHNPVKHVDAWRTPMLVIHGSLDYRVPIEQGLAAFTALQRRGVASKFLHFPDENHWVLKPHNSIQWHETVVDWLDAHTKG